jgi:hypothetical protein
MKSAGLGIVANGLIGDDGATKRAKGLQRIYWLMSSPLASCAFRPEKINFIHS